MMIWVDLRQFLEAPTWEAEQKLWHRLADEQRVILTPGGAAVHFVHKHTHDRFERHSAGGCGAHPDCLEAASGDQQCFRVQRLRWHNLSVYVCCAATHCCQAALQLSPYIQNASCQLCRRMLPWRRARLLPLLLCLDGRHRSHACHSAAHPEVPCAVTVELTVLLYFRQQHRHESRCALYSYCISARTELQAQR